jgi:hypothetical protein
LRDEPTNTPEPDKSQAANGKTVKANDGWHKAQLCGAHAEQNVNPALSRPAEEQDHARVERHRP